jgi:hypothetical protein
MKALKPKVTIALDFLEMTADDFEEVKILAKKVGANAEGGCHRRHYFAVVFFKSIESYDDFIRQMPLVTWEA